MSEAVRPEALTDALRRHNVITVAVNDQLFGFLARDLHAVFPIDRITRVPMAPPGIVGLVNLRGRIAVALSLSSRLGLVCPHDRRPATPRFGIAVEQGSEIFAILVDSIGEVVGLKDLQPQPLPSDLSMSLRPHVAEVFRRDRQVLYLLDTAKLLIPLIELDGATFSQGFARMLPRRQPAERGHETSTDRR